MEAAIENTILKELREFRTELSAFGRELSEFRTESNKRWEENNKRWEANDKRWERNDKRLEEMNERIIALEDGRKKDRKDILLVLDTMQKSIGNQFTDLKEHYDAKFEKIFAVQKVNEIEHEEFKKLLYAHNKRIDFHNARLNYLEEWKQQFDMGEYTAV